MNMRYAGTILTILLAGCSASHTANQIGPLPNTPSLHSEDVDSNNLHSKNVIHNYPLPSPNLGIPIATGSDNNVWFTEYDPGRIGKISQTGVVSLYMIPSGNAVGDIAAGASGTLWFTEYPTNTNIGKIDATTGHITEYSLPSGYQAAGITLGPDGNMWFGEPYGSSIGKITTTGAITQYKVPSGDGPRDIVIGPDGNLWFTEQDPNSGATQVAKVTINGAFTEYPSPVALSPIAAGPDGNLYAGGYQNFARITTSGVITLYPTSQNCCNDIVLGPDKQMWMTLGDELQEFNPKTQTFSSAVLLDGTNSVGGLTVGGDGDVWIPDTGGHTILVYEEQITTIGIRLNGELSFMDPNYGFELGYAVGTKSVQTQTISLKTGESVLFQNVDAIPHSAAFLGNATANNAPWPTTFTGSTTQSPASTAIGTTGWSTGSLNPNMKSPVYETGLPGFYMIGDQYDYVSDNMRTVIVVH